MNGTLGSVFSKIAGADVVTCVGCGSHKNWSRCGDVCWFLQNLERLVRVPTGCGEQNMIGFVPNILVRRYLDQVKLLTESLKSRTTANMITGQWPAVSTERSSVSTERPVRHAPRQANGMIMT